MEIKKLRRTIDHVSRAFLNEDLTLSFVAIRNGHIHGSFKINTEKNRQYLLQRINHEVFQNIGILMENTLKVTLHFKHLIEQGRSVFPVCPELVPAPDGVFIKYDEYGYPWRMFKFINESHVYDVLPGRELAEKGGFAFGALLKELSLIPAEDVNTTIPDFHSFKKRYADYRNAYENDPAKRRTYISHEHLLVEQFAPRMLEFDGLIGSGAIPLRITHNDTKFNNILFGVHDEVLCVIDLDTIMPGSVLHDFGDAIRTAANTAPEDEADLRKVNFDMDVFSSFSKGYLQQVLAVLTETEIRHLAGSAVFMTFMIGLRFLTDYLDGDVYYRIADSGQNLRRARVQFTLAGLMDRRLNEMQSIVHTITQNQ